MQVGEGDRASLPFRLALPVVGHLVAVAGLDVAIDAVVRDVQRAADVPLRVRLLPLVELVEVLEPGDALASFSLPELLEALLVDVRLRVRLRGEVLWRRVTPLLEEDRLDRVAGGRHLGHPRPPCAAGSANRAARRTAGGPRSGRRPEAPAAPTSR